MNPSQLSLLIGIFLGIAIGIIFKDIEITLIERRKTWKR